MEAVTTFFWDVAQPLLADPGVSKGTMMGFPCLRIDSQFFASADHRSGDLVVKLPASRVQTLIDDGGGQPFAPAGRRFREWVLIADRDADRWRGLIDEARDFVAGGAPG
ncbi:MAG: hypothetical protein HC802_20665 [Caldilineaceae bacterium]|nr:hypothetical protein [Caldilineaceae bacterium]